MKDISKRQEFIRLRGMNESYDKISKSIGISKPTLLKWSQKYEYELSQAKAKVLENVIEEYGVSKAGRLKIIAQDMLRLDVEINKRDLSSIPTSKLMQIKLKALEVAGNILDSRRVELGGAVTVTDDPLKRWEDIIRQCGVVSEESDVSRVTRHESLEYNEDETY